MNYWMYVKGRVLCLSALLILLLGCGRSDKKALNSALAEGSVYAPEVSTVEVITLERSPFHSQIISNGKLMAASRARLYFETGGQLATVAVSNGQKVGKGTLLARMDRPDLEVALEEARVAYTKAEWALYDHLASMGYAARDTLTVPFDLLKSAKIQTGFDNALLALTRARLNLAAASLHAPFRGRVADLTARPSARLEDGFFCTLLDDSSFDVDFSVMEAEYASLEPGLKIQVTPFALPDFKCEGRIQNINPSVDKNGQIQVRARVAGNARLLDGMNVRVTVSRDIPGQLVVPRSAVVIRDNLDVLFTYGDDGKAHWTYVTILAANSDSYSVTANPDRYAVLKEGDKVIISGNLNLADGSEVKLK